MERVGCSSEPGSAFRSCQLRSRQNFRVYLNPTCSFTGEELQPTDGSVKAKAAGLRPELESGSQGCLLGALSTRRIPALRSLGQGTRARQMAQNSGSPEKALQSPPPQHHTLRGNRRGRRDQAPGCHVASDDTIWHR